MKIFNLLPLSNKNINVQAYKYNGDLYRQWTRAKVIENNDDHVILHLKKTKVLEKKNQSWTIRELTLWFIPKNKKLYNAIITFRNGLPYTYINLSSSYFFENNTIKFIDYDLDIKCYPGKDFVVIDKKDFKKHSESMNYPKFLRSYLSNQIKDIFNLYIKEEYFFDINYLKTIISKIKK